MFVAELFVSPCNEKYQNKSRPSEIENDPCKGLEKMFLCSFARFRLRDIFLKLCFALGYDNYILMKRIEKLINKYEYIFFST